MDKSVAEDVFNQIVLILDVFKERHELLSNYWYHDEPRWLLSDLSEEELPRQVEVKLVGSTGFYSLEFIARAFQPENGMWDYVETGHLNVHANVNGINVSHEVNASIFARELDSAIAEMQKL